MEELKKLTETLENLNQLPKRMASLENVLGMADNIEDGKRENQWLKEQVVSLEQYSWKKNLLISGITILQNDNVREIVKDRAASMGINVSEHDMNIVHWLPNKNDTPMMIIAKLNSRELKEKL